MRCTPTRCRAMKRQHWAMLTISRPFPSIEWCGMFVVAIETFMSCGPRRGLIYHYKNRTKLQSVQRTRIVNPIKIKLGSNPEGEIHLKDILESRNSWTPPFVFCTHSLASTRHLLWKFGDDLPDFFLLRRFLWRHYMLILVEKCKMFGNS